MDINTFEAELYFSGVGVIAVQVTVTHSRASGALVIEHVEVLDPILKPHELEALTAKTQQYIGATPCPRN